MYTVTVNDLYADDPIGVPKDYQIQNEDITIGRARNNDIVLRQTNVSTKHASITKTEFGFFLEDLNSSNGTIVNGRQIHESVRIYSDDKIEIGGSTLRLSGHPALARSEGEADEDRDSVDDPYPFDSYTPNPTPEDLSAPNSVLNVPSSSAGSSISLDALFPYQDSQILKPEQPKTDHGAFNPFPVDGPSRVSLPRAQKPAPNLIDKIRKLESQLVKNKAPKIMTNQPGLQTQDAPIDPSPPPEIDASVKSGTKISVSTISLTEPQENATSQEFTGPSVLFGRAPDCDVVLSHPHISSHHAKLEISDSGLRIRDLNSKNGTLVNKTTITEPHPVSLEDTFSVGPFIMKARITTGKPGKGAEAPQPLPLPLASRGEEAPLEIAPSSTERPVAPFPAPSQVAAQPVGGKKPSSGPAKTNFNDVSGQLHLARKAIGKALGKAQNIGADAHETREICAMMAKAVKELFSLESSVQDTNTVQQVVDKAMAYLGEALAMAGRAEAFAIVNHDLVRALSLLYPFSKENVTNDSLGLSANPALSSPAEAEVVAAPSRSSSEKMDSVAFSEDDGEQGSLITRLLIKASYEYLAPLRSISRSVADIFFLDEQQSLKLENVVEEACTNAIEHAFDSSGQGSVYVSFFNRSGTELVITIDDQGMPFNIEKAESGNLDGLGIMLMRAFCKEVHFIDRGRKGKRTLLVVGLPENQSGLFAPSELPAQKREPITGSTQYELCLLASDQAEEISRCVYRTHGYGYRDELLYDSKEIGKLLETGKQISAMAFTAQKTGVGHMSVTKEQASSKIGELGHSIVVPQLKAGRLSDNLTGYLVDRCRNEGFLGLTSKLTTANSHEQIAFSSLGAVPTGLLLGHIPGSKDHHPQGRQTSLFAFLPLSAMQSRNVYLPNRHASILTKIYIALNLERTFVEETSPSDGILSAVSNVDIETNSSLNVAYIKVKEYGDDFAYVIESKLSELRRGFSCIYLDLPMEQHATQTLYSQIDRYSFIFSCLIPETIVGDVLRLQYINNFEVQYQNIRVDGTFGNNLLEYIKGDQARRG